MKKAMTAMLVAAMVLSMAVPTAAATPARDSASATTIATEKVANGYSLKMTNKTLKFYKGGKVVRTEVTKDGKVTLRKSNAGGISVLFINSKGKSCNITLGKQLDVTLDGTFTQISVDKSLGKTATIRMAKGSKVTNFYARGEAKVILSGTVSTLNVTNKNAKVDVKGTVTRAYTVLKSAISGLASSKITVNKTGTASASSSSGSSSSSKSSTYYSNGSSSTGGSGSYVPETKPDPTPDPNPNPNPNPNPDPKPEPGEQVPTKETLITEDVQDTVFPYDTTIISDNEKVIKATNCTFKGKVTIVSALKNARALTADEGGTAGVVFEKSTIETTLDVAAGVPVSTDANTSVDNLTVSAAVPSITVNGKLNTMEIGSSASVSKMEISASAPVINIDENSSIGTVTVSGTAAPVIGADGKGSVAEVKVDTENGGTPSVPVSAKTGSVTTTGDGKAGSINIGGNNTDTQVTIDSQVDEISVTGNATPTVEVKENATVDNVVVDTGATGKQVAITGSGTVTNLDTTDASKVDTDRMTTPPETVTTLKLSAIKVTTPPTKKEYYVGDKLDLNGLQVTATFKKVVDGKETENTVDKVIPVSELTIKGADNFAAKAGTETITVEYKDQKAPEADKITITVNAAKVIGLKVTAPKNMLISENDTVQLAAAATWRGTAGTAKLKWTTSNDKVATVTDEGIVKVAPGATNGTAKITATVVNDAGEAVTPVVSDEIEISVNTKSNTVVLSKIAQDSEVVLKEGYYNVARGKAVTAEVTPTYDSGKEVVSKLEVVKPDKTTETTDLQAVKLESGKALSFPILAADKMTAAGTYTCTLTVDGHAMTFKVLVPAAAAITGVTVSPDTINLEVGGSAELTATVAEIGGADKTVTWSVTGADEQTVKLEAVKADDTEAVAGEITGNKVKVTLLKKLEKDQAVTVTATAGGVTGTAKISEVVDTRTVTDAAGLEDALKAEAVKTIKVAGNITDADKVYTVAREGVTIISDNKAEVNGTFVVTAENVTIQNLAIKNKGGVGDAAEKSGIYFYGDVITVKNNSFTVGSGSSFGDGIVLYPKTTAFAPVVSGNTFTGFAAKDGTYASAGLLILQNTDISRKGFLLGEKAATVSADLTSFSDESMLSNTFESCAVDYSRSTYGGEGHNTEPDNYSDYYQVISNDNEVDVSNLNSNNGKMILRGGNITTAEGTLKAGAEVVVESGVKFEVVANAILEVRGTLTNKGEITVNGTLNNAGTVNNTGKITVSTTGTLIGKAVEGNQPVINSKEAEAVTTIFGQDGGKTGGTATYNEEAKTLTFTGTNNVLPYYEERPNTFPPRSGHWVGFKVSTTATDVVGVIINGKNYENQSEKPEEGYLVEEYIDMTSETTEVEVTVQWIKKDTVAKSATKVETYTLKRGTGVTNQDVTKMKAVTATVARVTDQAKQVKVTLTDGTFHGADNASQNMSNWKLGEIHPTTAVLSDNNTTATLTFEADVSAEALKLTMSPDVFIPATKTGDNGPTEITAKLAAKATQGTVDREEGGSSTNGNGGSGETQEPADSGKTEGGTPAVDTPNGDTPAETPKEDTPAVETPDNTPAETPTPAPETPDNTPVETPTPAPETPGSSTPAETPNGDTPASDPAAQQPDGTTAQ